MFFSFFAAVKFTAVCLFSDLFWLTFSVSLFNPLAQLFYFVSIYSIWYPIMDYVMCSAHSGCILWSESSFFVCAGAEPLPIITFPCKRFYFFFRFQFFSLSFSPALWDGLSNLSSTFLNYFSVVSVLCLALSKTVHLFHYYSLQFFSCLGLHLLTSVYILGNF